MCIGTVVRFMQYCLSLFKIFFSYLYILKLYLCHMPYGQIVFTFVDVFVKAASRSESQTNFPKRTIKYFILYCTISPCISYV